ncbi:MAG TPA: beta-ketoacyl synthase N-terminal-like domain-containing protein, partial [Methylovirgula sp.]|nr:beta-ketoacyl synthase N-terminal-like domain-containing protein [Methylovirgula sp.]
IWTMLFNAGWTNAEGVKIVCGGEALPAALRAKLVDSTASAWNVYGPTETTIWSSLQALTKDGPLGIGRPLANTQIYIIDDALSPTPIGVAGEIHIAGAGLARGYLNQPEMTAERFIDHPFDAGQKLYRTGDMGCWRADGTIDYLGRRDGQIKLRGYRIELGEIEAQLAAHPGIASCAVVLHDTNGHQQLVAHYVPRAGASSGSKAGAAAKPGAAAAVAESDLRAHLKATLPSYMIPAAFQPLTAMPLTPNGKIDRKRLATQSPRQSQEAVRTSSQDAARSEDAARGVERKASHRVASGQGPQSNGARRRSRSTANVDASSADATRRTTLERQIADIWKAALGKTDIAPTDGFFEIGGDSIIAVSVADTIRARLTCDFDVTALFANPTIQAAANYIHQQGANERAPVSRQAAWRSSADTNGMQTEDPDAQGVRIPDYYDDSLAIIGISSHFPGAADHFKFWQNLLQGHESIEKLSSEELQKIGAPEALYRDPGFIAVRSVIDGKDLFDPAFFKIAPKDAALMDPQARLLLLHAWKAVEDAGYIAKEMSDTGVFMSAANSAYGMKISAGDAVTDYLSYQSWLLSQGGTIPTLVSYKLGLHGPSYLVQSNCSSSLVALHVAYQNIMQGDIKQALVGAATLLPYEPFGYLHQEGMNFSADGHIRAFDANANGMVAAEGVAVVLVKRASDAVRDGDNIYAIVRNIAVNNDGTDKAGFYAPSVQGQVDVICRALDESGIDPETISYVEAHGTGTVLGDPIEFRALTEAYRKYTEKSG